MKSPTAPISTHRSPACSEPTRREPTNRPSTRSWRWSEPGERWLDIGAGAGRYALPIARALAPSGGEVIALDPSASMLDGLREIAAEHDIDNVRTVEARWPPATDPTPFAADVTLIAHVGYDIESIGPFLDAMESVARRLCVALLMERQPSSIADACWPPVHGEARVPLPALPEFLELLRSARPRSVGPDAGTRSRAGLSPATSSRGSCGDSSGSSLAVRPIAGSAPRWTILSSRIRKVASGSAVSGRCRSGS